MISKLISCFILTQRSNTTLPQQYTRLKNLLNSIENVVIYIGFVCLLVGTVQNHSFRNHFDVKYPLFEFRNFISCFLYNSMRKWNEPNFWRWSSLLETFRVFVFRMLHMNSFGNFSRSNVCTSHIHVDCCCSHAIFACKTMISSGKQVICSLGWWLPSNLIRNSVIFIRTLFISTLNSSNSEETTFSINSITTRCKLGWVDNRRFESHRKLTILTNDRCEMTRITVFRMTLFVIAIHFVRFSAFLRFFSRSSFDWNFVVCILQLRTSKWWVDFVHFIATRQLTFTLWSHFSHSYRVSPFHLSISFSFCAFAFD